MKAERRFVPFADFELRESGDVRTFTGYAAVYSQWADLGGFEEQVAPDAFKRHINRGADVRLLVNHEGTPLARTKSGTLKLASDDHGLHAEAELDEANPKARELISAMERRDIDQMSFGFQSVKDSWDESGDIPKRTLEEVKLFDVSPVTYPAYEGTSAEVRSILHDAGLPEPEVRAFWKALHALQELPEQGGFTPDEVRAVIETLEQFSQPADGNAPEEATPVDALDQTLVRARQANRKRRFALAS